LSTDASENLRGQLVSELEQLKNPEALANWAHRALPHKNQLLPDDAQAVEGAFSAKLAEIGDFEPAEPKNRKVNRLNNRPLQGEPSQQTVIVISKPVRERDREHLRFVATQPCLVCGRTPSDAHHVKFAEQLAMGRKVSDRFTVPICRLHHRELHRLGNERTWWENQGIDPLGIAASLWGKTHVAASAGGNTPDDRLAGIDGRLNGRHFVNIGAADRPQNCETKPILRRDE
jgi:hypothetical protein